MSWAGNLNDFRDGVSFTGAGNGDTTPSFTLLGGRYLAETHSTGTPSMAPQLLGPDGSFVPLGQAVTTVAVLDLPPGTYNLAMGAAASTAAGSLIKIPYRQA